MGGFANLKKAFKEHEDALESEEYSKYLMLLCLFEIAGNLDTIAVEMRNQTKVAGDMLKIMERFPNLKSEYE